MKQILFALIISISLHLLAIYLIKDKKAELQQPSSKTKSHKISDVKFVRLQNIPVKQQQDKVKKAPKKVETKKQPKVVKKLKKYTKTKKIIKKAKRKIIKKPLVKTYKKQTKTLPEPKVNYEKLNPTKLQKQTLDEYLSQPLLQMDELDKITRKALELYKEEYDNLTQVQKVFLQNNLRKFQIITQRVLNRLGYPRMAARLNLSGTNVVEFMFHPDGSISDLKITNSSGYAIFDNYTLELIEIAYKDYPRPEQSTKIKFYVQYIGR